VALKVGNTMFGIRNYIGFPIRFYGAALSYHKWREPKNWKL